jgi:hypothetical protein
MSVYEKLDEIERLERDGSQAYKSETFELPADAMSLDLLQAIYRSAKQPLPVRMRAAALALPHEFPKLQAVISADVSEQAFGDKLERARLRTIEGIPPREGPTPQPRALPGLPK